MAETRLLRMSRPLGFTTETLVSNYNVSSRPRTVKCLNKVGLSSDLSPAAGDRNPTAAKAAAGGCSSAACTVVVSKPKTHNGMDLGVLFGYWRKFVVEQRFLGLHIQFFLEKAILDCRFFTLFAIGGSLLCSVRCFFEGCFLVVGSYLQYFNALSRISEKGQVVHLLLEAIDMFIMGTAMVVFAMALYVMFVGQNSHIGKGSHPSYSDSALSTNFQFKKLPSWMAMESAMEAKSKIGHAVMLILQVQVLDKFRSIAVRNGMDLACLAGAIFLSSASIFILSRISAPNKDCMRTESV